MTDNVQTKEDPESGEINATEQINYMREVLFVLTVQMTIYTFACGLNVMSKSYTTSMNSFVVLIGVGCVMVACGFVLYTMEEYRRKDIVKYVIFGLGTAATALFMSSLTAIFAWEFFCNLMIGGTIAVATCYIVSRNIESTKSREDVRTNMLKGLGFGLAASLAVDGILLYMFGSKDIYTGMIISSLVFVLAGAYVIYAMLYIIIPSLDEDEADNEDIIYGVVQCYIVKLIVAWRVIKLCVEKCKGGSN